MKKSNPNLYIESFGILLRKYEQEDCRKTLAKFLTKVPSEKSTLVSSLFQPVIEMMDVCQDLALNPENPLYASYSSSEDSCVLFCDLFFEYYDPEKEQRPLDVIPGAFSENQGRDFIQSVLAPNEELNEAPIPAILHSTWKEEEKLRLLNILVDGDIWIQDFCLLLEEIAKRINPILECHQALYQHLDQLLAQEHAQEEIFRRLQLKPLENSRVLPVISTCNMGFMRAKIKDSKTQFLICIGVLLCAIDFSVLGDLSKEQLCERLKCLSDPTKLSILTILKNQSTYQSDLAKQLGLTTATISHHMNKLFQNGFVKYQFIDKKIYYEYQSEQIPLICEELKKLLT